MKTVSGIIPTAQLQGGPMSFGTPTFSGCDRGSRDMLGDLRRETTPALRQTGRPMHLFRLDISRAALVVIDMQNFSCAPSAGEVMPDIDSVIAQTNKLADRCRSLGVPVIWVRQNFTCGPNGDDGGLYGPLHDKGHMKSMCDKGTGTEIFRDMHFDPANDHVVFKNRYSAFLSSPPELKETLDKLKRTQLIMAGVAANVCVESTARDAMQMDYEVTVVADATSSLDRTLLKGTLKNIMLFFGDVRSTNEVIDELGKSGARKDG